MCTKPSAGLNMFWRKYSLFVWDQQGSTITYYLIYMGMFDYIMHGATDIMYGVTNIESVRNSKEKNSLHPKVLKYCLVLEKRLSIYYL